MHTQCRVSADKQPWDGSTVSADQATKPVLLMSRVETNTSIRCLDKLSSNCTSMRVESEDIKAMKETSVRNLTVIS